jgi:hypothetical protein
MTAKAKHLSLRIECPKTLYEQIADFRFTNRYEKTSRWPSLP